MSPAAPPAPPEVLFADDLSSAPLGKAWILHGKASSPPTVRPVPGVDDEQALVFAGTGDAPWRLTSVSRTINEPRPGRWRVSVEVREGGLTGKTLSGAPLLRVDAQGAEQSPRPGGRSRTVRLAHAIETAAWTPPGQQPVWQTLTATVVLPAETEKARIELASGRGSAAADSTVAFRNLQVRR